MERTVHRGSLGEESFTDLDYADDVASLAEVLKILILYLKILDGEGHQFGLEISWNKTKIKTNIPSSETPKAVVVTGNTVEVVKSFTYLGSL